MTTLGPEAWTAIGTWALVLVTVGAVIFGALAAAAATRAFRLEAEPKLVVRQIRTSNLFARGERIRGLLPTSETIGWNERPPAPDEMFDVDDPVFVVDGRAGADGLRIIANGFAFRPLLPEELTAHRTRPVPKWPAIRIEVHNVGRSPAVQAGLTFAIEGPLMAVDRTAVLGDPMRTEVKTDQSTLIVDGVGPNDRAYVWIVNHTGTPFSLKLVDAYQRDPTKLTSGKTIPIDAIAASTFRLSPRMDSVPGEAASVLDKPS